MSRYQPLHDYLERKSEEIHRVELTFGDVEDLVGPLPRSARDLRTWWGNSAHGQAMSWQSAGWIVDSVNLTGEAVVFVRGRAQRRSSALVTVTRSPVSHPDHQAHDEADNGEAAVQARLVSHLTNTGWQIIRVADTASREQGFDVLARKAGRTLAVEVKGYPTRAYADPRRAGQVKPTAPPAQARHWFAQAILKAMLIRDEHPDYEVAIALPDKGTYRSLFARTMRSFEALGVRVVLVAVDGAVTDARPQVAGQP